MDKKKAASELVEIRSKMIELMLEAADIIAQTDPDEYRHAKDRWIQVMKSALGIGAASEIPGTMLETIRKFMHD